MRSVAPKGEARKSPKKTDPKLAVIILLAVAGAAALVISEALPEKNETPTETVSVSKFEESDYAAEIERKLTEIISSIEGSGQTKVMVTLESSVELVYAKDTKIKSSESADAESFDEENEYIIIEDDGAARGMTVKTVDPKIRGVAVVCTGGDSEVVRQRIVETVTAVLDISAACVSVAKMGG